jgi:hypothetical protein
MSYQTDAILDRRLPKLEPTATVKDLQLFIDDEDNPTMSVIDGEWYFNRPFRPWTSSVGLHGDDGWLYYQSKTDGTILSRTKKWVFPRPTNYMDKRVGALEQKLKKLVELIRR